MRVGRRVLQRGDSARKRRISASGSRMFRVKLGDVVELIVNHESNESEPKIVEIDGCHALLNSVFNSCLDNPVIRLYS
jgi:hypothetical protein